MLDAKEPIKDYLKSLAWKNNIHNKSEKKIRKIYATHDNRLSIT